MQSWYLPGAAFSAHVLQTCMSISHGASQRLQQELLAQKRHTAAASAASNDANHRAACAEAEACRMQRVAPELRQQVASLQEQLGAEKQAKEVAQRESQNDKDAAKVSSQHA